MSAKQDTSSQITAQGSLTADVPSSSISKPGEKSKTEQVKRAADFSLWSIINGFGGIHASPPPGSEKHKQKAIEKFQREERKREAKKAAKKGPSYGV